MAASSAGRSATSGTRHPSSSSWSSGTQRRAPARRPPSEPRRRRRDLGQKAVRPSWYALDQGGWRDYVTLLHLPYTAWHLSYVVIGGCLAPAIAWGRLGAAVAAFARLWGSARTPWTSFCGRPLRTRIPDAVLVGLAVVSIGAACAIGVVGADAPAVAPRARSDRSLHGRRLQPRAVRRALPPDLWFGLAWGGFPLLAGYAAVAGELAVEAAVAAAFAVLLSLAQRVLSNRVRFVRRHARRLSTVSWSSPTAAARR